MKKINLNDINGNEIIDFLNTLNEDDYPKIDDISIVQKSFVFEDQKVFRDRYTLSFTASYNNWGTHQEYHDNKLYITEDELWLSLEEPFEGDGTDTILETILKEWIENHTFKDHSEQFYLELQEVYEKLPEISFSNIKEMEEVIKTLTKLKSYMK